MTLLHDIQSELLDTKIGVGTLLLKLRFLAAKLEADVLEEWVQFESDGYPDDVQVPDYRKAGVTYTGTFTDMVKQLNNVSIASYLVEEYGGEKWVSIEIRDSVAVIDDRLDKKKEDGYFKIDAGNLKLLLQGKIYPGMAIIDLEGRVDDGVFTRIQHAVRSKVLDFILKLEKQVPAASLIRVGGKEPKISAKDKEQVNGLVQHVFYGDVVQINNSDISTSMAINVDCGNTSSLIEALIQQGVSGDEAKELASIAASEKPSQDDEGSGNKGKTWLSKKLKSGAAEAWGLGKSVAREVITEALKQYYGLK